MAESDGSEIDYKPRKSTNKSRHSLFLPSDTIIVSKPTETTDEEYVKILKSEEDTWKQIIMEQKEQKKNLIKKLEKKEPHIIDYSLFDEEEIKYLNSGPDMALFVEKAKKLQDLVKVVNAQCEQKRQKCALMLETIENACSSMASIIK